MDVTVLKTPIKTFTIDQNQLYPGLILVWTVTRCRHCNHLILTKWLLDAWPWCIHPRYDQNPWYDQNSNLQTRADTWKSNCIVTHQAISWDGGVLPYFPHSEGERHPLLKADVQSLEREQYFNCRYDKNSSRTKSQNKFPQNIFPPEFFHCLLLQSPYSYLRPHPPHDHHDHEYDDDNDDGLVIIMMTILPLYQDSCQGLGATSFTFQD